MKEESRTFGRIPFSQYDLNTRRTRMKNPNFYIRLGGFLLILAAFFLYNNTVKTKEQEQQIQELSERVEILEKQQKEMLTAWEESYEERLKEAEKQSVEAGTTAEEETAQEAETEDEDGYYLDGSFEGSGTGYGGTVTVQITLEDQEIRDITVVDAPGEDSAYLSRAQGVISEILETQSTAVDTVSGATFSSAGILEAVNNALEKAENK